MLVVRLFTYGDLNEAEDVLTNMPAHGGIWQLALVLPTLLPLPSELDLQRDVEPVRNWIRRNRERLRWSMSAGAYLLDEDFQGDDSAE